MNRTVVLQPATRAPLKTSHTKSPTHNELKYVKGKGKVLPITYLCGLEGG